MLVDRVLIDLLKDKEKCATCTDEGTNVDVYPCKKCCYSKFDYKGTKKNNYLEKTNL